MADKNTAQAAADQPGPVLKDPVAATASGAAPVAALVAEAPKPRPPMKPLLENRMTPREQRQNEWIVFAEKGTPISDLLNRDFWAHCAGRLRDSDKICVMADDRSYYVELVVFRVAGNWAVTRIFGEPIIADPGELPSIDIDYEAFELGLQQGWGVRSRKTGAVIKGDGTLRTQDEANAWLRNWLIAVRNKTAA